VQRAIDVIEFSCGIPQLLKGDFTDQVSTGIDNWTFRQRGAPDTIRTCHLAEAILDVADAQLEHLDGLGATILPRLTFSNFFFASHSSADLSKGRAAACLCLSSCFSALGSLPSLSRSLALSRSRRASASENVLSLPSRTRLFDT